MPFSTIHARWCLEISYSGRLSAAGNSPMPDKVRDVRDELHPQLRYLWQTHIALKRLRQTAIVLKKPANYSGSPDSPFEVERDIDSSPTRTDEQDLCEPLTRNGKKYLPLVRQSLDLNCHLNIQFLRQEDPGSLVFQGGDVDNRLKTLFDALKVPDQSEAVNHPQKEDYTYCLLESDSLISGFNVLTDRLLFPKTDRSNEVHIVIEVVVRVLKVGAWNMCLMGN